MSKVLNLLHIVFCTKSRKNTIPDEYCEHLYRFIWKELKERKCALIRINGTSNHVHLLIELHSTIALSRLMSDVKSHSSGFLKADGRFPLFEGWSPEYFAASISASHRDAVVNYIIHQKEHHRTQPVDDELQRLYSRSGMSVPDSE